MKNHARPLRVLSSGLLVFWSSSLLVFGVAYDAARPPILSFTLLQTLESLHNVFIPGADLQTKTSLNNGGLIIRNIIYFK
jgi:hypothetical protein